MGHFQRKDDQLKIACARETIFTPFLPYFFISFFIWCFITHAFFSIHHLKPLFMLCNSFTHPLIAAKPTLSRMEPLFLSFVLKYLRVNWCWYVLWNELVCVCRLRSTFIFSIERVLSQKKNRSSSSSSLLFDPITLSFSCWILLVVAMPFSLFFS